MKPSYPMDTAPIFTVDLEALLAPVPDGDGAGVSLRYEPLYQQIRDAQREDDPTLPMREWERPLIKADWNAVASLCSHALEMRSKDFQLAAWLCEAWTRLHRVEGCIAGTRLLTALAGRYWDNAWPRIEGGDAEARTAPFVWLNDTLARVLTLYVPLITIEGREQAAITLDDWQHVIARADDDDREDSLTRELLAKHVTQAGNLAALVSLHQHLDNALDAWLTLTRLFDDRLGSDAPGLARVEEALTRLSRAATSLLGEHALPDDPSSVAGVLLPQHDPAAGLGSSHGAGVATHAVVPGVIASRAQAYRLVEAVADYLAQHEPHSPTPYLLRRAVSWGQMPLGELMREIIREEGDLGRYLAMLDFK
jgi:type VI secretion system protein ImpA